VARLDLHAAALHVAKAGKVDFGHDRTRTVGASEIGLCAKRIAARKQGEKPDAEVIDDPGFAVRGDQIETHWAVPVLTNAIEKVGGELRWAGQDNQTTIEWKKKYASCTPDGLFTNVPRDWLAGLGVKKCSSEVLSEIKSIDPRISPDRLPKAGHPEQAHYGLGLVRNATDYRPDFALLTYWNCSKYTEIAPLVIPFNEAFFEKQLSRAKRIITTPWKTLPSEGKLKGSKECKNCEFALKCLGKRYAHSSDTRAPAKTIINL